MINDFNWKTWSIVFLIALGGTIEILKRLPSSKAWDSDNLRAPKLTPWSAPRRAGGMNKSAPAMITPPNMLPAGAKPAPKAFTPPPMTKEQLGALLAKANPPGEATAEEKAKKKKEDDEWEIVVDPKTGKKIKRKKKKVAKKEEKKKEEEKKEVAKELPKPVEEDDDKEASDGDINDAIATAVNTGRLNPRPPNKPDSPFESADEWIKRLLGKPNLAETNRFIDHFRKNLVTAEVFYQVVGMMLNDSRSEMKKLGILACSATPTYPMSFQLLAGVSQGTRADADVKAKADEVLNSYIEFNRLSMLERVLKTSLNNNATYMAAVLLEKSAQKNLGAQTAAAPSPTPAPAQQSKVTAYQRFVAILGNLTRTAPDPKVKTQAGQTQATIQGLIGNTSTVAQQQ